MRVTRRRLLSLTPWLALGLGRAVHCAERLPAGTTARTLRVYGALDRGVAEPLMAAFQRQQPAIRVDYHNLETNPLYQRVVTEMNAGRPTADLLLSPAMDLQMKLANDGYAQPYRSLATRSLPDWARWREEAFGYAFDPVVMAYHRRRLPRERVPANRYQLITLLRREAERLRFRVATYDPARSGAGYLYLSQDAEHYPAFWELIEALGEAGVRLYDRAAAMLEDLRRDLPRSSLWPIRISPGLMVYLDPLKQRNFLGRLEAPLGALWTAPAP